MEWKQTPIRYSCFALASIFFWILCFPVITQAASLRVHQERETYGSGDVFTVDILIDPHMVPLHAVRASLRYDPTLVSIVSVSRDDSVFSLWTDDPTYSNSVGKLTFGAATPMDFTSENLALRVTLEGKRAGDRTFFVDDLDVDAGRESFTNLSSRSGTSSESLEETHLESFISSPVFSDPVSWYDVREGEVVFHIPERASALRFGVSTSSIYEPTQSIDSTLRKILLTKDMLSDGVQYATLTYTYGGNDSTIRYPIHIDSTPPDPFALSILNTGNGEVLKVGGKDSVSSIAYYEVHSDGGNTVRLSPQEGEDGTLLANLETGKILHVFAYDAAGNRREASTTIYIRNTADTRSIDETRFRFPNTLSTLLLLLSFLVALVSLTSVLVWRKEHRKKQERLQKETEEIKTQTMKIFSALRDEVYFQMHTLTKKKRLSAKEKVVATTLKNALSISQKIIEKEIRDVKKIIRD